MSDSETHDGGTDRSITDVSERVEHLLHSLYDMGAALALGYGISLAVASGQIGAAAVLLAVLGIQTCLWVISSDDGYLLLNLATHTVVPMFAGWLAYQGYTRTALILLIPVYGAFIHRGPTPQFADDYEFEVVDDPEKTDSLTVEVDDGAE